MIPADLGAVRAHAAALARRGDELLRVGRSLRSVPMPEGWTGAAADAFRTAYAAHPGRWLAAGDAHHDAAAAVGYYADVLTWAQEQSTALGDVRSTPFDQQLRELLDRITTQVGAAGDDAARAVARAASSAPTGSLLSDGITRLTNDISDISTTIAAAAAPAGSTIVASPIDRYGRLTDTLGPQLGDFSTITSVLGGLTTTGHLPPAVDTGERLEARKPKPEGVPDENPPTGVPTGWIKRPANNGKGWYWQKPGTVDDSDQVRLMGKGADPQYPDGYARFYNEHNQPVDAAGKPSSNKDSHFPMRPDGSYDLPEGWNP